MPGMTVFCQQQDSGEICLKPKQFDFYAQAVVDRRELKKDSVVLELIIKSKDIIIQQKDIQIQATQTAVIAKDSIAGVYRRAYKGEEVLKVKLEKRAKTYKNLSLVLGSVTVALFGVLLIVR